MRLVCPNCDAQYDVADSAIPPEGRDVQCSSCSQTWFQPKKKAPISREVSRILSTPIPSVVKSKSRDVSAYDSPQAGRSNAARPRHEPTNDQPRKRGVDPKVAEILREEAERSNATHGISDYNAKSIDAQKEAEAAKTEETRKRIAAMTSGTAALVEEGVPASRVGGHGQPNLNAIPDMTEINAALRSRSEANAEGGLTEREQYEAERRRGFRRGFLIVLILIALFAAPYIYADELVAYMPELQGYVATYVAVIDQLRLSLDTLFKAAVATVENLIG